MRPRRQYGFLSMRMLFGVSAPSFKIKEASADSLFYVQIWSFVE